METASHTRLLKQIWGLKIGRVGLIIVITMLALSIIVPIVNPHEIDAVDLSKCYQPPSGRNWFGTDELGRDLFTRVFYAGRISILVGVSGTLVSVLLGLLLGSISAYLEGPLDAFLLKLHEIQYCFPPIILVLTVMAIIRGGTMDLILLMGLFSWPTTYRLTRNQVLAVKREAFVEAARLMGNSTLKILFKHILPNIMPSITVNATLLVADLILLEAALSFLGVGVSPPTPSWGNMLNVARSIYVLSRMWWLWFFPGLMIVAFVMGVTFLGEALDTIVNPHGKVES
ncbi:MAG: ABC transporter permease [Thermotoga caldifontis]|uniref:ABC transporter permease n=1 Tax=Thermotoga caldifontis TaxID=1508419 RepID=UPI003C7CAB9E